MNETDIFDEKQQILKDTMNLFDENHKIQEEILKMNKTYNENLKDLIFAVIPISIDWKNFNLKSEEEKEQKINDICKNLVAEPLTITKNDLDDYGLQIPRDVVVGVITKVTKKDENTLNVFVTIWATSTCIFMKDTNGELMPKGIHVDIESKLNEVYYSTMKKRKEINQKITKIISDAIGQDELKNTTNIKPEFEKYLENQEKKE